jgi:nicotinamidase-related amidase
VKVLLFTQCLQNDFVAPLAAGAPLPNALHIGPSESRRLLGDPGQDWEREGPLARFLAAWRERSGAEHAAFHLRDWHDPAAGATQPHLERFGQHCLQGSPGARFVAPLAGVPGTIIDSAVLSDFVSTPLDALVQEQIATAREVRAAIIGVWTDVKVRYLAYELVTRMGLGDICICSALVASRSRIRHREALEHMASILGVTVIESVAEFAMHVGLGPTGASVSRVAALAPRIVLPAGVSLEGEERQLVEYLFRDCREVTLAPLGGGFSGSRVFRTASVDQGGRTQIPFVVKIDTHSKVARERVAVESVENMLGAASPRIAEQLDLATLGAIKYQFATMHAGAVRTLKERLACAPDPAAADGLIDRLIERVLQRLYQQPSLERVQLFEHYSYRPEYVAGILEHVDALGEAVGEERLRIPGLAGTFAHPAVFYRRLPELLREQPVEAPCVMVHGDLNLANVLIDDSGNTWLIDYFWTRTAHALMDIAKLENDIKFLMLPLADDAALGRALDYECSLLDLPTLPAAPVLAEPLAGDLELAKAHAAIARLRALAAALGAATGDPGALALWPYWIAQLRYSAHTLSFDECHERQKRLALASTCLLAERLLRR